MRRPKIVVDARFLDYGFGLADFLHNFLLGLSNLPTRQFEYVFLINRAGEEIAKNFPEFSFETVEIGWYGLKEQIFLPFILFRLRPDLVFFPHWNIPIFYPGKFVFFFQDLTMFHYPRPEATTRSRLVFLIKDMAHRLALKSAWRRATRVIANTDWVRRDGLKHLSARSGVEVVYQSPPPAISEIVEMNRSERRALFAKKFGLSAERPFILYAGAAYPHKNLPILLKAFLKIEEIYPDQYSLIFCGPKTPFYDRLLQSAEVKSLKNFYYLGRLSPYDYNLALSAATIFCYPSLSEGFGLPPLEAMAYDTPVVCSTATCLPEVCLDAPIYFDPTSADDLFAKLDILLHDEALVFSARRAGRLVVERYRPEFFAAGFERICREVI